MAFKHRLANITVPVVRVFYCRSTRGGSSRRAAALPE